MQALTGRLSRTRWISHAATIATSRFVQLFISVLASAPLLAGPEVRAQAPNPEQPLTVSQQQILRTTLNNGSLYIATGHADGSYLAMAHDIAMALGKDAETRVLPIIASGGIENLRDLIFLRGVDMAIVPANALAQTKAIEALVGAGLPQRIAYITHLHGEELHLLVGSSVGALEGLRGRKVAVHLQDGNAQFTARDLFERLGVEIEIVRMRPAEAIEQARSGELAAVLLIGGKPLQHLAGLPKDGRLRFMSLPFTAAMEQGYSPAALRAEDYPTLIPPGVTVETVAVSAILMANNAKGYEDSSRRIAKFVPVFFGGVADLTLVGRHPKWKELNLSAPLPGWTRLPVAAEWLRNAKEQQKAALQREFDEFLRSTRQPGSPEITAAHRKKLFEEFVDWTRQSVGATKEPALR